ncbi:MAG: HlyD family efflux transporter periplasmic adaptor subunit, partial [Planctomycetota bacterium]
VAASFLSSCAEEPATSYLGYVEGEYVYVASPLGGELRQLEVARGSEVEAGDVLFQLDPNPEVLQIEEAEQRVRQAQARLTDLEKGRRPTEIAAIESRLRSARTAMDRAERDYERRRELYDAGQTDVVSDEELAGYRADRDVRRSEVTTLEADLETARLGGREDAVEAARIEVEALEAALSERRWKLGEKTATAASAGWIQDTLYRAGEYVPAARPVVSLLPPENVKVRFFVPQDILPTLSLGDRVDIRFDGMENPVRAEISFLSSEAEFTPPVIYSQDSRTKLVFLVEATPDPSAVNALRPGQPVDVDLNGASR